MKKKPQPPAIQLAAGLTALAALGSAIINRVDPVSCLARGALAYFAARFLAGLWYTFFGPQQGLEVVEPEPESMAVNEVSEEDQVAA